MRRRGNGAIAARDDVQDRVGHKTDRECIWFSGVGGGGCLQASAAARIGPFEEPAGEDCFAFNEAALRGQNDESA